MKFWLWFLGWCWGMMMGRLMGDGVLGEVGWKGWCLMNFLVKLLGFFFLLFFVEMFLVVLIVVELDLVFDVLLFEWWWWFLLVCYVVLLKLWGGVGDMLFCLFILLEDFVWFLFRVCWVFIGLVDVVVLLGLVGLFFCGMLFFLDVVLVFLVVSFFFFWYWYVLDIVLINEVVIWIILLIGLFLLFRGCFFDFLFLRDFVFFFYCFLRVFFVYVWLFLRRLFIVEEWSLWVLWFDVFN